MDTGVYINGREACSKANDGSSKVAFPDPCWSPPSPPAGPIVLPYPNTAYSKDLAKGTRTVFIRNRPVAKQDVSYFSTSTGNEPATQAFAKGVMTGVIKGKAYFTTWSPNVKFEGKCVARHNDLMTHNHGSVPGNTPTFPYLSRSWNLGHQCKKEEQKIAKACGKQRKLSETEKTIKSKSKLAKLLAALDKKKQGGRKKSAWHWTDDHCAGLGIKLNSNNAPQYMQKMEKVFKAVSEELNVINKLEAYLKDLVINAAGKVATKLAIKAAAKQAMGSVLPGAGNAVMGIWSVVDAAIAIGDIAEIKAAATEGLAQVEVLKERMKDILDFTKEFKDFSQLSTEEKLKKAQKVGSMGQDILAALNACTRARKCNLVPFNKKGGKKNKLETAKGLGCCKGQTGHHLINGAMMKTACPNYDHGMAPTVCVEGINQYFGSHKRVHDAMDKEIHDLVDGEKTSNGTMSLDQAIEAAAKSHRKAFRYAGCSKNCIQAQLESYYKQICKNARPKIVDKKGKQHKPDQGSGGDI